MLFMAIIQLNNGGCALVDATDFRRLSRWKWTRDGYGYALRFYGPRHNQKQIRMHRAILDAPDGIQVDHINGDPLDNRRRNLRLCNNSQNQMNKKIRKDSKTGLKGVTLHKSSGLYMARLKKDKKLMHCSYHKTPEEASRTYNLVALKYHGKFAKLSERYEEVIHGKSDKKAQ